MSRILRIIAAAAILPAGTVATLAQATVRVQPPNLQGPRELQEQTAKAVVQDYIESWQTLGNALEQNRAELLDRDFVGDAKEKIAEAIQQQLKADLHTSYRDTSHDVQIVFYSPEGLSVQLVDTVEYDVELSDRKNKVQGNQHVRSRYVVVLTPSETRWRVRVLEAVPLS